MKWGFCLWRTQQLAQHSKLCGRRHWQNAVLLGCMIALGLKRKSMMPKPLHLTVAGHTNVGKTSLLRTLGRNPRFGLVENAPNISRNVAAMPLKANSKEVIVLFDTPGLEDAMALREYIDELAREQQLAHWDGPAKVAALL